MDYVSMETVDRFYMKLFGHSYYYYFFTIVVTTRPAKEDSSFFTKLRGQKGNSLAGCRVDGCS